MLKEALFLILTTKVLEQDTWIKFTRKVFQVMLLPTPELLMVNTHTTDILELMQVAMEDLQVIQTQLRPMDTLACLVFQQLKEELLLLSQECQNMVAQDNLLEQVECKLMAMDIFEENVTEKKHHCKNS